MGDVSNLKKFLPGQSGNPGGRPKGSGRVADKAVLTAGEVLGGASLRDQAAASYVKGSGAQKRLVELCSSDPKWEKNVFWPKIWLPVVVKYSELEETDGVAGYHTWVRQIVTGFIADNTLFQDVLRESLTNDKLREIATQCVNGYIPMVETTAERGEEIHNVVTDFADHLDLATAVELDLEAERKRANAIHRKAEAVSVGEQAGSDAEVSAGTPPEEEGQ